MPFAGRQTGPTIEYREDRKSIFHMEIMIIDGQNLFSSCDRERFRTKNEPEYVKEYIEKNRGLKVKFEQQITVREMIPAL